MFFRKENKLYYGYIVASSAFFIQLGTGAYITYGVFFNSFLTEFSWSRAVISGASSLCYFTFGLLGILAGRLVDKIGPRIVMTFCGIFFGLGYILMSQVQTIWQLYLFNGLIVAIGFSAVDVATLSTIVRWFTHNIGIMTGIIKVGAGFGMLLMPLMANWLISIYGWRASYIIMGSFVLTIMVVASQFLKRNPSKLEPANGEARADSSGFDTIESGASLREAIHKKELWTLCCLYFFFGFCSQIALIHSAPYAIDSGASLSTGASLLSILGGTSIAGRFIMGGVIDRIGSRWASVLCFAFLVTAFLVLLVTPRIETLYLFAVFYGFGHGGLWVLLSPIVAEIFGVKSHGSIFSIVYFVVTLGGTIGPLLAGYIFDITGSYKIVFSICLIISSAAIALAGWLIKAS